MTLEELDADLATRYGAYAGFATSADPVLVETHGDAHSDEMDRLLHSLARPESCVLDLGCGAGQTLCALAPKVREIWGIDLEAPLLEGARARSSGFSNVSLVLGDTTDASAVEKLPDGWFDLVFSRRGPFLTSGLMSKLTENAYFVIEMAQDSLGLKETFGRKPFTPRDNYAGADGAIQHHAGLGWLPVSVKDYYYELYFRDSSHLEAYLATIKMSLSNWWMESKPFDPVEDAEALRVYVRYNTTAKGIRLTNRRKIYLFRRAKSDYYPVDGA